MRFGTRVSLAMLAAALLPLAVLALVLRQQLGDRLVAQYELRTQSAATAVLDAVRERERAMQARLAALARNASDDNELRLAIAAPAGASRHYLLEYAARAMSLSGLSFLQMQDESGRILSSGHFRQEYDRLDPALLRAAATSPGSVLVRARTAEEAFVAMVRLDSLRIGARTIHLIGGIRMGVEELGALLGGSELRVELATSDTLLSSGAPTEEGESRILEVVAFPYVAGGQLGEASLHLIEPGSEIPALRRSIDRLAAIIAGGAALLAIMIAGWLSSRVSRPVTELAERTAGLDLDRLEADFRTDRDDEIGDLSRTLGSMTARLRASVRRLRDAERRATQGDMARQVNHDVKNGLVPIRNVLRHLAQVARDEPDKLARIFAERRATLDASVEYLEDLARSYARLSPEARPTTIELEPVIEEVAAAARATGRGEVQTHVATSLPQLVVDPLPLRRVLENVVGNAMDSLGETGGRVVIAAEGSRSTQGRAIVLITISDNGHGMSNQELSRAFEDFHTTRVGGTGLGLSVVRRLVADLHGVLRIDTAPAEGTRVSIELPAASAVVAAMGAPGAERRSHQGVRP